MKTVNTVLGPVPIRKLGHVLTHEHFSLDFRKFYTKITPQLEKYMSIPITLKNSGYLRQYPYSSEYNLIFYDEETHKAVLDDLKIFKEFGGGTIVENSCHGLKRNLGLMQELSRETGVHVIAGTGHYVEMCQLSDVTNLTVENLYDLYRSEIQVGCQLTSNEKDVKDLIKCGFIGEVGSVWPITDFERRCIQATGMVQELTKCPVSFHPGRDKQAPFEIIRLYQEAGGDTNKCIMSHLDRTLLEDEDLLNFAELGCYNQFDLFGIETSYYQLNLAFDMPSDSQRIEKVMKLLDDGRINKILISHDIHTKHRLTSFGGHGYAHIISNVCDRMQYKGLTKEQVQQIVVQNPANWLEMNE